MRSRIPRFRLRDLLLLMAAVCVVVAALRTPVIQAWNNQGHGGWMRASPFTDVLVQGDDVVVEFRGARYELVSINGASTEAILESAWRRYGFLGEKRFIEDLPEVLAGMGFPRKRAVSLVLRDAGGNKIEAAEAPMTAQNRARVYQANGSRR
jgi:hypothetical protein